MNRDALLELLSNSDRTFSELPASSAIHALRDDVVRARTAAPAHARANVPARVGVTDPTPPRRELANVRLDEIPELSPHIEHAHLHVVASFVAGDHEWVGPAAAAVGGPSGLDAAALERLVADNHIDEATARRVGFMAAVYEAVERDTRLTRIVREAHFSVSDGPARSTLDLARTPHAEWLSALGAAGLEASETARVLADRFAAMHPGAAFSARLASLPDDRVARAIVDAEPLFARNPRAFETSTDKLDLTDLEGERESAALASHTSLRALVASYPDLELTQVLDDRAVAADVRAAIVVRRVRYVKEFVRTVGEERALFLDYGPRSADLAPLAALGASPEETKMVVNTLKTHQRVFALTGKPEAARALLASGFIDARTIARLDLETFRSKLDAALDPSTIHHRARKVAGDAAIVAAALLDIVEDPIAHTSAANVPPSALDYLRELDGYDQLFGSLSFCACEECNSILGPAAYFVDLMRFVDENVRPQFATHPSHPLDLKTRRPDLWTVPLTCENTRERLPILQIVDEILETFIANALSFAGTVDDQRRLVYEMLATASDSFALPFSLPVEHIDRLLEARGTTRAEIARALGKQPASWASARLKLTVTELQLITTADLDIDHHRTRYGVEFQLAGTEIVPVDVQEFRRRLSIDRDSLSVLIATNFVTSTGAAPHIVAEKSSPDSLQNDVERVYGLTLGALDRIHRLARLQRHVPWLLADLDAALVSLARTDVDSATIIDLAKLLEVQTRWSLAAGDARALVGSPDETWLARTFLASASDPLPDATRMFIHAAFRDSPTTDAMQTRLAVALGATQGELEQLIRMLAPVLSRTNAPGFNPADPDDSERGFVLSAANLTVLYRHARVARLLGVSIGQLEQLCTLGGFAFPITSAEVLLALADLERWRQSSGYSLDDLAVATGQTPLDASRYPSPGDVAVRLVDGALEALTFESNLLAVSTGVSESASKAILKDNPTLFQSIGARWRVRDAADLTNIVVPASAIVTTPDGSTRALTVAEARAVFENFAVSEVVAQRIGEVMSLAATKVRAIAHLANAKLGAAGVAAAMFGGPRAPVEALVESLTPFVVAFQHETWDAAAVDHVAKHRAAYGLGATLSIEVLHALASVAELRTSGVDSSELINLLETYKPLPAPNAGFPPAVDESIARVLGIDLVIVRSLRGRTPQAAAAPLALEAIRRAASMARDLGVDGAGLAALVADDFATLTIAADALTAAARREVPKEMTSSIDQQILERRRDALVAEIVEVVRPDAFRDQDDLSAYFLIDVRTGGCQTSSRVIAATSSVQQYVHRLIIRLEQDRRPADDPAHLEVTLSREASNEWSWRKNYRVWEANRKVFLWPENYLEPDLRDDKTPLFVELEKELLQGRVTEQSVLDAYSAYLSRFEELANLTIAGAYHDVATRGARDVLHLFGASHNDPVTFYYRSCENLAASGTDASVVAVWSPWRKIDVQITGRRVSPVVFNGRLHVFWTDYKTRSRTKVVDGGSEFDGYQHTMRLRFTTLRLDGSWTPPQDVTLPGHDPATDEFALGRGILYDWFTTYPPGTKPRPRFATPGPNDHPEPLDDYTVEGPNWDWVWPEPVRLATRDGLLIRYRDFMQCGEVDLFSRELVRTIEPKPRSPRPQVLCARGTELFYGSPVFWNQSLSSVANLVIDSDRIDTLLREDLLALFFKPGLYQAQIATLAEKANLLALPGNVEDAIVQIGNDVILVQGSVTDDNSYVARRIGTTLATKLARTLFSDGVEGLLDIETQKTLLEAGLPLTPTGSLLVDRSNGGTLDFKGPYGTYYREIFFHIPALLANHLNSQGQFAAAQRWYQYIFDPTATEVIQVPAATPALERERLLRDRVWRYLELRGLTPTTIRDALTDPAALEKYRRDPFNPHAIARLRITAYQKGIVMRYIDNLLDWADHLFTQFTMESVNEAVMLYLTAAEILGKRPAELGPCIEDADAPRTYESIAATIGVDDAELLIELESWLLGGRLRERALVPSADNAGMTPFTVNRPALVHAVLNVPLHTTATRRRFDAGGVLTHPFDLVVSDGYDANYGVATTEANFSMDWNRASLDTWSPALARSTSYGANLAGGRPPSRVRDARTSEFANAPTSSAVVRERSERRGGRAANAAGYAALMIDQLVPAFCVPPNSELHAYWDRLDDRLFKIRHCMDITGQLRELALLEPAVDPRLLAHAMAGDTNLGEIANGASSALPPYRFAYLIDRAKSYAATLQGFGSALLAAREKKDAEEMSRLSVVHQKNIATLSTRLRDLDLDIAQQTLESTEAQRDAAIARRDFFQGLLDEGNNGWEQTERIARHLAAASYGIEGALGLMSAISTAFPQIGSPFAMKYGGVEVGGSMARFARVSGTGALLAESVATSAAIEGNYARRNEGWRHQRDLARRDVLALERQVTAAALRVKSAERSRAVHQRSIEQLEEVSELLANRFSNLGRYTWLAQQLQRLYRDAYDSAMTLARLAEQAYRFEREDDAAPGLESSYWDAGQSGLLAGERLLIALQSLERRFLETHDRTHEIDQPVSLGQIDPAALIRLRETGTCEFTIPELAFDLFYPGHYKRRIKGVRLTIPCITGPYVNVSTTLELTGSQLRRSPAAGQALVDVPPRRTTSIATSTAQNDGGVFEMSFRDERYLPFEGAGAVSSWRLSLPSTFRPFDYATITDVIVSISYTAVFDGALRARVESTNAAIEGSLLHYVRTHSLTRVLSLRQDFSAAFTRLLRSPLDTEVRFEITDRHFPLFAQGKALSDVNAFLAIRTKDGITPGALEFELDGAALSSWAVQPQLGGLRAVQLPAAFTSAIRPNTHSLKVAAGGNLAPAMNADGSLDVDKLFDILLFIEYRL